jgi:hypothetical protein
MIFKNFPFFWKRKAAKGPSRARLMETFVMKYDNF